MNYTNTQLDIIRTFGSKELSEGCIVNANKGVTQQLPLIGISCIIGITSDEGEIYSIETYLKPYKDHEGSSYNDSLEGFMSTYTILGHIPHLFPDVARVAKEKGKHMEVRTMIYDRIEFSVKENPYPICIPYNPTLSLLDQSEKTLVQLLNLFKPS